MIEISKILHINLFTSSQKKMLSPANGKVRALDNIYVERLWRSLKYENIYLNDYKDMKECKEGIRRYFKFYNGRKWHQEIDYRTPNEVYFNGLRLQQDSHKAC